MMWRALGGLGALRKNRHGAVAAEFALVSPLLFSLVVGIVEFSLVMFSYSAMQFGATIVARDVSVNKLTELEAPEAVKAYVPTWVRDSVTVTINQSTPADPRTNIVSVTVQAPATEASPMTFFTRLFEWTISAEISLSQELPYED